MKRTTLFVYSFFLAVILSVGAGCAKKADDATISSDIQTKFSQDSGLSTKQLTVQSANGVVTLSGNVDNDAQREAASRQAASTPGVKEVVNNLQVGNAPTKLASATRSARIEKASNAPPADKMKPTAGKKSPKSHAARDSASGSGTSSDVDADQLASNQSPQSTSQMAAPPPDATPAPPPPPHCAPSA